MHNEQVSQNRNISFKPLMQIPGYSVIPRNLEIFK